MSDSLISIILPVYNTGKFLVPCLDALLAQTWTDWECLLIDDGSSDGSEKICDEYAARDARFRLFHHQNQGPGKTRNFGIDQATGTYLTLLDHDDLPAPNWLETMHSALVTSGADFVIIQSLEYFEDTQEYRLNWYSSPRDLTLLQTLTIDEPLRKKLLPGYIEPWRKLMRTDFVREHGLHFSPQDTDMDDVLFHFLLVWFAKSVYIANDYVYVHRMHSSSAYNRILTQPVRLFEYFAIFEQLAEALADRPDDQKGLLELVFPWLWEPMQNRRVPKAERFRYYRTCVQLIRKYGLSKRLISGRLRRREWKRAFRTGIANLLKKLVKPWTHGNG